MQSRALLGASLLVAGTAHAGPTQDGLDAVTKSGNVVDVRQHRVDGVIGTDGAGAQYRFVTDALALEVQAYGAADRQGLLATVGLARFDSFGVEHDVVVGAGYNEGDAETQFTAPVMSTHTPLAGRLRGEHRFLSAYINDTVRFIRGLDVTTGLVVEQWKNLGGDSTITYGSGPPMDIDTPDVSYLLAPTLSVRGELDDTLSIIAQTYRGVEELGPTLQRGRFAASVRGFDSDELGRGIATEASVQPVQPVVASVGYLQTPDVRRAMATVTYSDPRFVALTARYDSDERLDALAVRRLHGAFSGFVGVADALGPERQLSIGVRGYFASGTP